MSSDLSNEANMNLSTYKIHVIGVFFFFFASHLCLEAEDRHSDADDYGDTQRQENRLGVIVTGRIQSACDKKITRAKE